MVTEYYSKSSLLAPFPNRIADGTYKFGDNVYQLPLNKSDENNAIHGFVSNKAFSLKRSEVMHDGYELELSYESGPTEGYPFPFETIVLYRLAKTGELTVRTEVKNIGQSVLPIGLGWHPYFMTNVTIDDLELRLPRVQQLEVDSRLIPTGRMFEVVEWIAPKSLRGVVFDTGFQFASDDKIISLYDRSKNIEIKIICKQGYEYVQVFTPPWRTSIAIEPMTCAADAFNNKFGAQSLKPGESLLSEFEIAASVG